MVFSGRVHAGSLPLLESPKSRSHSGDTTTIVPYAYRVGLVRAGVGARHTGYTLDGLRREWFMVLGSPEVCCPQIRGCHDPRSSDSRTDFDTREEEVGDGRGLSRVTGSRTPTG